MRRRWWQLPGRSIETEAAWFAEAGLHFRLDEGLLSEHDVVAFSGRLHDGDRSTAAVVVYPPAYGAGAHPIVVAAELRLGRHQAPNGVLCLDHPILGESAPMYGAEAALRAERLWHLVEHDPAQLELEEADAPDPRANYYSYEPDSAVFLIDADVVGYDRGYVTLAASGMRPLRAAVTSIRATHPAPASFSPGRPAEALTGPHELHGPWVRVPQAPPVRLEDLLAWLRAEHRGLVEKQLAIARKAAKAGSAATAPGLVAFVYPDEGPRRHEIHDAWLFVLLDPPHGNVRIPFGFHLREGERWVRQPQLAPLGTKRIAIVGVGALGSPVADLLAKAGVGAAYYVDHDVLTPGNRVRHQLDLADAGRAKVTAMASRAARLDPWSAVDVAPGRLGEAGLTLAALTQHADDAIVEQLATCDVIVNTTANHVAAAYLSQVANDVGVPVVHAYVSPGAWGARVLVQRPGESGCWECLARAQRDPSALRDDVRIPRVSVDPAVQEVHELGCADPTFTGPGFDLTAAAAAVARAAAGLALEEEGGYPSPPRDLLTLRFRDAHAALPAAEVTRLPIHPACEACSGVAARV